MDGIGGEGGDAMWAWLWQWRRQTTPAMAQPDSAVDSRVDSAAVGPTADDTDRSAPPGADGRSRRGSDSRRADRATVRRSRPRSASVAPERLFAPEVVRQAWLAVKRAGGGAGMDGVTIAQFEARLADELQALQQLLASGRYQPKPARQVWVPKANGGLRPLTLWALRDRIAQRVVYDLIVPEFEPIFLPCSFGFRPGLGVQDAVKALQKQRDAGLRWVVDADIEDCFGAIPTERLMGLVAQHIHDRLLLRYIRGWLDADIMNSADGRPRKTGTSQGSVLSPLLANVYLHQIDLAMMEERLAFLRYADDFVICCRRRRDAELAREFCDPTLAQWGLRLNGYKTQIVHLDQGLTWLGHFFVRNECFVL